MKHAYLLMIHNIYSHMSQIKILLGLLDDKRNDIYIHIDKKDGACLSERAEISAFVHDAGLFFVASIKVEWGGFSQVAAELILLKEARKKKYEYYHLLSGADLPLKSQDEIHAFFDKNQGMQFFNITTDGERVERSKDRYKYYHIFQDVAGRKAGKAYDLMRKLMGWSLTLQRILKINRIKGFSDNFIYAIGGNWFSITDDLACLVLHEIEWIKKTFRYGLSTDEVFLQEVFVNSKLYDNSKKYFSMRYIDWERGNPYVYRINDYDSIMSSGCVFARKFDMYVDKDIIKKIEFAIKNGA